MQAVVASARTLQDITDERVVPVDYLGVLILLFMLLVLDRLFYSLGLHLGKVISLSLLSKIYVPSTALASTWVMCSPSLLVTPLKDKHKCMHLLRYDPLDMMLARQVVALQDSEIDTMQKSDALEDCALQC